jgi:hypothetical protein
MSGLAACTTNPYRQGSKRAVGGGLWNEAESKKLIFRGVALSRNQSRFRPEKSRFPMHRLLTTTAVALLLAKQATPPGADTSGGAPPSAGVSSATESSDISGDAEERAKELNR